MALIKHHHRDKMLNGLGVVVFIGLPWLLGDRTSTWAGLGQVALLLGFGGLAFGQIVQLANLTIDPERKRYVCWWGPFVPLWRVEGHLGDIIGLEVAGLLVARCPARRAAPPPHWVADPDRCAEERRRGAAGGRVAGQRPGDSGAQSVRSQHAAQHRNHSLVDCFTETWTQPRRRIDACGIRHVVGWSRATAAPPWHHASAAAPSHDRM